MLTPGSAADSQRAPEPLRALQLLRRAGAGFAIVLATASVAWADNVTNNVTAGGSDTIAAVVKPGRLARVRRACRRS